MRVCEVGKCFSYANHVLALVGRLQLKFAEVGAPAVTRANTVGFRFGLSAKAHRDELLNCVTAADTVSLIAVLREKVFVSTPGTYTNNWGVHPIGFRRVIRIIAHADISHNTHNIGIVDENLKDFYCL